MGDQMAHDAKDLIQLLKRLTRQGNCACDSAHPENASNSARGTNVGFSPVSLAPASPNAAYQTRRTLSARRGKSQLIKVLQANGESLPPHAEIDDAPKSKIQRSSPV